MLISLYFGACLQFNQLWPYPLHGLQGSFCSETSYEARGSSEGLPPIGLVFKGSQRESHPFFFGPLVILRRGVCLLCAVPFFKGLKFEGQTASRDGLPSKPQRGTKPRKKTCPNQRAGQGQGVGWGEGCGDGWGRG